jgi:hypothetical protein
MPLDCNDGAALRIAPVKGPDPKLRNEFCPQVSPSQVRDAWGPHDGNEHTLEAIVSDCVHSLGDFGVFSAIYIALSCAEMASFADYSAPRVHQNRASFESLDYDSRTWFRASFLSRILRNPFS